CGPRRAGYGSSRARPRRRASASGRPGGRRPWVVRWPSQHASCWGLGSLSVNAPALTSRAGPLLDRTAWARPGFGSALAAEAEQLGLEVGEALLGELPLPRLVLGTLLGELPLPGLVLGTLGLVPCTLLGILPPALLVLPPALLVFGPSFGLLPGGD